MDLTELETKPNALKIWRYMDLDGSKKTSVKSYAGVYAPPRTPCLLVTR